MSKLLRDGGIRRRIFPYKTFAYFTPAFRRSSGRHYTKFRVLGCLFAQKAIWWRYGLHSPRQSAVMEEEGIKSGYEAPVRNKYLKRFFSIKRVERRCCSRWKHIGFVSRKNNVYDIEINVSIIQLCYGLKLLTVCNLLQVTQCSTQKESLCRVVTCLKFEKWQLL